MELHFKKRHETGIMRCLSPQERIQLLESACSLVVWSASNHLTDDKWNIILRYGKCMKLAIARQHKIQETIQLLEQFGLHQNLMTMRPPS